MWDTTACPECGELAEVEWRAVLESTDGPVEHAKVRCVRRHWFLLPVASLVHAPDLARTTASKAA
jgi:hypothetical protein